MGSMIQILDENTINKIAAGEVIERPLSIVKELVENSIDAGAKAITIEIKGGGIDFIRVTDNGAGISPDEVRSAFLSHATSKIKMAEDLFAVKSLGFRGEALATIAAVCQVEMITKTADNMTAVRYRIDGGKEVSFEEIGGPEGSTFIARNLFFHTPARRKFLRSAITEAGYITEFVQQLAICYSDIAIKYVVNNQNRLVTTGKGDRTENIYKVYGREIAQNIMEFQADDLGVSLSGYAARPLVARNNRDYEIFFVNGHAIKDRLLEKAVEEAYKPYLMQHKFPFIVLVINIDPGLIDVNVHPRKSEVKFVEKAALFEFVRSAVNSALSSRELINKAEEEKSEGEGYKAPRQSPEPFEMKRAVGREYVSAPAFETVRENDSQIASDGKSSGFFCEENDGINLTDADMPEVSLKAGSEKETVQDGPLINEEGDKSLLYENPVQQTLDMKIMSPSNKPYFRLVGQVFDTYWIMEYMDKMYIIDQHAAHEKVMYERFVKEYKSRSVVSQYVNPPLIITLSGRQETVLQKYLESFNSMGFEIEHFEGSDYAVRAVPSGFMKLENREIFLGLLDELSEGTDTEDVTIIHDRLAQMSCKAAVKGNTRLSFEEADELLSQLLSLENPYNCPHGRPTMIEYSEKDLEKKFKRIV